MFRSIKSAIESIKHNHKFQKYFTYEEIVSILKKEIDSRIQENTKIIKE